MSQIKVSVIIPAYNEEKGIGNVCKDLIQNMDLSTTEIIVIDDGSTDRTAEIVRQYPEIRLIQHRKNRGYGFGIRTGTKAAQGEYVVWYDADGQHRPEDLKKIISTMIGENLDYCIGVRGKDSFQERNRKFGKWLLKIFIWNVVGEHPKDFNSGLRGFKKNILIHYLPLLPKGFGASTVTTLLMQKEEYIGKEVPIRVLQREGKSTVKQFRDGFRTLGLIMNIILLFEPMKVFGTLGFLFAIVGFVYGITCALINGFGISVLASSMMMLGAVLVCFGIINSQISSMRIESRYLYEDNPADCKNKDMK